MGRHEEQASVEQLSQTVAQAPQPSAAPSSVPAAEEAKPGLNPGQKELDVEGMNVVLPQGFHPKVEDVVTVTGEDPDLRILLSADPLRSASGHAFKELHAEIETDPALSEPREEALKLSGRSRRWFQGVVDDMGRWRVPAFGWMPYALRAECGKSRLPHGSGVIGEEELKSFSVPGNRF